MATNLLQFPSRKDAPVTTSQPSLLATAPMAKTTMQAPAQVAQTTPALKATITPVPAAKPVSAQTTYNILKTGGIAPDALAISKQHFEDTIKGRDFMTQNVMNQFSEQNAAMSAAKRAADAQKANLSGVSQSTQNLLGRLSGRDIEQQRQQGLASQAQVLGARADNAAGQLSNIGQFETNLDYRKQLDAQEQSDKEYREALATQDPTTPEGYDAIKKAAEKAGYTNLTFDKLVSDRWEAKKDKANTEILNWTTTYKDSFYDPATGKYDTAKMASDPQFMRMISNSFEAESGGTLDWDNASEATKQAFIDKHIKSAMITDSEASANEFVAGMSDYFNSEEFKNLPAEQQQQLRDAISSTAMLIKTGLSIDFVDGKVVIKDPATGKEIAGTETFDKEGNEYNPNEDGSVTVTNKDGSTTVFTQNGQGEWTGVTKVPDGALVRFDNADKGEMTYFTVVANDDGTKTYTDKTGKVFTRLKDGTVVVGDGSETTATKDQLEYIKSSGGETVDNVDEETGVKIPDGTKVGDFFTAEDGSLYTLDKDRKPIKKNVLDLTGDDIEKWLTTSIGSDSPMSLSASGTGTFAQYIASKYPDAETPANALAQFIADNKDSLSDETILEIAKQNTTNTVSLEGHDIYNSVNSAPSGSVIKFGFPASGGRPALNIDGVVLESKNIKTSPPRAEYTVLRPDGTRVKVQYLHSGTGGWSITDDEGNKLVGIGSDGTEAWAKSGNGDTGYSSLAKGTTPEQLKEIAPELYNTMVSQGYINEATGSSAQENNVLIPKFESQIGKIKLPTNVFKIGV